LKHEQWYKDYQAKVFTIVMGQCDKLMQNQVETAVSMRPLSWVMT
jgi:hypothetical protein